MCLLLATATPALATDADYAVPDGRVFTQTAGDAPSGAGYLVSNAAGVPFWTAFQEFGGPMAVGYPVTQRFVWNGFVVQAMQKVVFQWHPATAQVLFINIFDEMSRAGHGDSLAKQLIPHEHHFAEDGLPWLEVISRRQALLNENPRLREAYFSRSDPLLWFGLPTSAATQFAHVTVIRTQRAALQLWHVDLPWARAGEVTVANGGDLAKSMGMFPESALQPSTGSTFTAEPPAPGDAVVDRVNRFRADLGLPALNIHPALMEAAQAHADYYVLNRHDPTSGGLHTEVPGKPLFTGWSIADRARAAGYPLGWVDETLGHLPPASTLEWALGTVFHRYMFVHPSAVDIGYGWASADGTRAAVFNVGLSPRRTAAVPLPSVVPRNGSTDVGTTWDGSEWPDPAPGITRPLGPPITLIFGLGDEIVWDEAFLMQEGRTPISIGRSTSTWRGGLALIPYQPLQPGVTYTVLAHGVRNGRPFSVESQFTTAS